MPPHKHVPDHLIPKHLALEHLSRWDSFHEDIHAVLLAQPKSGHARLQREKARVDVLIDILVCGGATDHSKLDACASLVDVWAAEAHTVVLGHSGFIHVPNTSHPGIGFVLGLGVLLVRSVTNRLWLVLALCLFVSVCLLLIRRVHGSA